MQQVFVVLKVGLTVQEKDVESVDPGVRGRPQRLESVDVEALEVVATGRDLLAEQVTFARDEAQSQTETSALPTRHQYKGGEQGACQEDGKRDPDHGGIRRKYV